MEGIWILCRKPTSKAGPTFSLCLQEQRCIYIKNSEQTVAISSAATIAKYYRYFTQEEMLLICANFWLKWIQWILCLFCLEHKTIFLWHSSCVCVHLRWWLIITMQEENYIVFYTMGMGGFWGEWGLAEINCHEMWRAWRIYVAASFDKGHLSSCQLYWLTKEPHSVTFYFSF